MGRLLWMSIGTFTIAMICFSCGSLLVSGGNQDSRWDSQELSGTEHRTHVSQVNPPNHFLAADLQTQRAWLADQQQHEKSQEEADEMSYMERKVRDSIIVAGYISLGAGIIMLATVIAFMIN